MIKRFIIYGLIISLFLGLAIVLYRELYLKPQFLTTPLENHVVPAFKLNDLFTSEKVRTIQDLPAKISVINIWGTWCNACQIEHPVLMDIAAEKKVMLYGFNYKDDPEAAKKWLNNYGNPYQWVVRINGEAAIEWGIYGAPETYLLDPHHVIRYRYVGVLTSDVWKKLFVPKIHQLEAAAK